MNKRILIIAALFMGILSSCQQDDMEQMVNKPNTNDTATRALYDQGYVEWDNTLYLTYKYGSDIEKKLPIPWAANNSQTKGIPNEWLDANAENPNASLRAYSHANGWEMVYCNLLDPSQRNKYFALYNKYTGIMRFFLYVTENYSGSSSNRAFIGTQVENTSLLNFTESIPQPMDVNRNAYTSYFYTPTCSLGGTQTQGNDNEIQVPALSYLEKNWYGTEFECSYDSNPSASSQMNLKLWSADVTITKTDGNATGEIKGNITTTYSSSSPAFNLNIIQNKSCNATITQTVESGTSTAGDKIEKGVKNNDSFFTELREELKEKLPSDIQGGVKALCSQGASRIAKSASELICSIIGVGNSSTQNDLNEEKQKSTYKIKLSGVNTLATDFGSIKGLPIPGTGSSSTLYNNKLGVWNLSTAPTVKVDLFSKAYFYKKKTNQSSDHYDLYNTPYNWQTKYQVSLNPVNIVVNPILLTDFTVQNKKTELVMTNKVTNTEREKIPYRILNGLNLYQIDNSCFDINENHPDMQINPYSSTTSFAQPWQRELDLLNDNNLYCKVSFELKKKTTGEIYSYSKYFKVNVVKGTQKHQDIYNDNN